MSRKPKRVRPEKWLLVRRNVRWTTISHAASWGYTMWSSSAIPLPQNVVMEIPAKLVMVPKYPGHDAELMGGDKVLTDGQYWNLFRQKPQIEQMMEVMEA